MSNINLPFDIDSLEILSQSIDSAGNIELVVCSKKKHSKCHKCGKDATIRYGSAPKRSIQHTSIMDRPVYIKIVPERYRCEHCDDNTVTTEQYDWCDRNAKITKALEAYILRNLINSTVQDVSIKNAIGYKKIVGALNRRVGIAVDWSSYDSLETLGLDEISMKKGYEDFVTILSVKQADGNVSVLSVMDGRKKEDVLELLKSIPADLRRTVKRVCSDMYDGYVNASIEVFGEKSVVIDRYHVAKGYRKPLDDLRIKEMHRLKSELPDEGYAKLKGLMWIIRKKHECLTETEKTKLEFVYKHSPALKEAHSCALKLTHIFNTYNSKKLGIAKIKRWVNRVKKSEITCFNVFISTLEKNMSMIANYFKDRSNSGFVEGINNKIKVTKRRCYGFFKIESLFQRLQLDFQGMKLFPL